MESLGQPWAIVDIETNGLSHFSGKVIEIGVIRVEGNRIVDEFQSLVNPGGPLPQFISNLTGISTEEVLAYSSSKGCAELVTAAFRNSFFRGGAAVASARAGNVIGGGDWARDRLVPDAVRAFAAGNAVEIRNPRAIRPWQHVLEPLAGYLTLAQSLFSDGAAFAQAWNFGPAEGEAKPVAEIVEKLALLWGDGARWRPAGGEHPHEAHHLKLDCSKARALLGWVPRAGLDEALAWTAEWYRAWHDKGDLRSLTEAQIERYAGRSSLPR